MSFSTTWSVMLSILFLTDLELKTEQFRKVERGLTNDFVCSEEFVEVTLEDTRLFMSTVLTSQRLFEMDPLCKLSFPPLARGQETGDSIL